MRKSAITINKVKIHIFASNEGQRAQEIGEGAIAYNIYYVKWVPYPIVLRPPRGFFRT